MKQSILLLSVLMLLCGASPLLATAQTHFKDCASRTGDNATVIIPATAHVRINDAAPTPGDELAVITHSGVCVGRMQWRDGNMAFPVWGDNIVTADHDGLTVNEPLLFVAWAGSDQIEYNTSNSDLTLTFANNRPYATSTPLYAPNAIYILTHLAITPHQKTTLPSTTPLPQTLGEAGSASPIPRN